MRSSRHPAAWISRIRSELFMVCILHTVGRCSNLPTKRNDSMPQNRISVLVSLDGADDNLKATLNRAEKSLNDLAGSAKTAGEKATAGLAEVKAGVAAFSDQFNRAKTQLIAFLAAFEFAGKVQEIIQIADAWNMMNARLKLATAGSREYTTAQQELYAIAQRIGVPLQETATLYGKLQQAVRMLGGEQKDALQITESISQALRISGASVTEAQSALLQFGQALSSGVLRGEEFNSVVENSPRLAQALADGLNVPIGRLRKMAEEGKLTADVVVNALLGQKDKLAAEYAQLPQTVSQAFERLKNAFGLWVHQLDESTGFTHKLAAALDVLTQHLDTVMKWLNLIKDVGLAVIIYRLLPALATAWQTAGAAGVMAANATAAAWTTANLSIGAAIASAGALKVAFGVLTAAFVGWEIGTWLSDKFETVRKAGVFMVQALMTGIEHLRYGWESFAALFSADTLAAASQRHQERLGQMQQIFASMYKDAERHGQVTTQTMNTAASAAEEIARRLEAVRQGTQEAVGRAIETVHASVEKLKTRLGEVESAANKANQTINDGLSKLGESYKGLTVLVEANLAQQLTAVQKRYDQELTALNLAKLSEAQSIAKSTELLTQSLSQQTQLRQQATQQTLALIERESQARLEAAKRHGDTEAERRNNVARVENEILTLKRQTLQEALASYVAHVNALNAEANRHLQEIKRIEDEKRQLHQTTEERIRELNRSTMTDYEAYQDKLTQIAELQEKARTAIVQGEFEQAKQYAQQAADLAAQTAHAVKQGDQEVISQKQAVKTAIEAIRTSEELTVKALDGESRAHREAAEAATGARRQIEEALRQTQSQIDEIATQLQERFNLTIDVDTTKIDQALADLDRAIAEKERLLPLKIDLEQAEKQLAQLETQLKEGKTVLVNADVSKAETALTKLAQYAKDNAEVELRVATDKALSSVQNVQRQITALADIETQSRHQVQSNAADARAEILSLDGMATHSTHTVHVRKVEENAVGGVVGAGVSAEGSMGSAARFASGGAVGVFPRMTAGKVPGSGNGDTVPRTLEAGAFVIRKAAVRQYGEGLIARLASGVQRFATGGSVRSPTGSGDSQLSPQYSTLSPILIPPKPKRNRDVVETLKIIELGFQGLSQANQMAEMRWGASGGLNDLLRDYAEEAQNDRAMAERMLPLRQLTTSERQNLERIKQSWKSAMSQMLLFNVDLERDLIDYMEAHQGEFYARGGMAKSDTVPAMLTPGEYVIKRDVVDKLGVGFFEALNGLKLPAQAAWNRVRGYASGGIVQPLAGLAARASRAVHDNFAGRDLMTVLAESLSAGIKPPTLAMANDIPAPSKTLRVELASGNKTVTATVDAQDEAKLLDLLKQAQARAF